MPKKLVRGFTLIELLVVIAIIGILAVVVTVNLSAARAKARDARRKNDLATLQTALDLYYDKYAKYPTYSYNTSTNNDVCVTGSDDLSKDLKTEGFLTTAPVDPKPGSFYCGSNPANSGGNYRYFASSDGKNYNLAAKLETKTDTPTINYWGSNTSNNTCFYPNLLAAKWYGGPFGIMIASGGTNTSADCFYMDVVGR